MGLRTDDEIIDTVEEVRPASSIDAVRQALGHTPPTPPAAEPAPPARKLTLAEWVERIDNAADVDSARVIRDEALLAIADAEAVPLVEAFERAWES